MGKCSHEFNLWAVTMVLVPKCSVELSTVRGQGSEVRGQGSGIGGQGSGVRGQNRGQISRFGVILIVLLDLTNM